MIALVTGGGGFLARYIIAKLRERGDDVVSLSRKEYPHLAKMGITAIQGDISDKAIVAQAVAGADVVFHIAAKVGVWGPWEDYYKTNVIGTRNVIEACCEHGVSRLVYTSSPSVIFDGKPHEGIDETYPYPQKYIAHYPHTKAIAEQEVLAANGREGLYTCALRPHLVWGPLDTNLIPRLIEGVESGKLRVVGNGENVVDMVYVENAADAHILAGDRLREGSPVCGQKYFITNGEPVNLWDQVNIILAALGKAPLDNWIGANTAYMLGGTMELMYKAVGIQSEPRMTRFLAMQLSMNHHFSIEKAKAQLGYKPAISMEEGLNRLVESYT